MRDFRTDKETSIRTFAELCVTRQIITAIKTATRFKALPSSDKYVSFSHPPAGQEGDGGCTLDDAARARTTNDPSVMVISTEELPEASSSVWAAASRRSGTDAPPLPRRILL